MPEVKKAGQSFMSQYDNVELTGQRIKKGWHRNLVGAKWDEMGELQLNFLKAAGLLPEHKFLDIGCGSLRAGVKIIPYLNENNYYGIDREKRLIDVGYRVELGKLELHSRLKRANLYCSKLFKHERLPNNTIDFAICNSVMTHIPINFLRICLENTQPYFKVGAKLFITFFEIPFGIPFTTRFTNSKSISTFPHADPYHYYATDMINAANGTKWDAKYIGDWNHPRDQKIVQYTRTSETVIKVVSRPEQYL